MHPQACPLPSERPTGFGFGFGAKLSRHAESVSEPRHKDCTES